MQAKILKLLEGLISKPLVSIFNLSLSTGVVPDSFKIASVIPVYKKGSQIGLNNYRPISLLSIFNRILEKIIFKRLITIINKHTILYNKQFGFRSKHSTLQAILLITDKAQRAIDDDNYSCAISLDLCKVFDTVNHHILIQQLEYYGIKGIAKEWFKSYLENRKQYLSLGSIRSRTLHISCGVPQGSVLGPLLFLL